MTRVRSSLLTSGIALAVAATTVAGTGWLLARPAAAQDATDVAPAAPRLMPPAPNPLQGLTRTQPRRPGLTAIPSAPGSASPDMGTVDAASPGGRPQAGRAAVRRRTTTRRTRPATVQPVRAQVRNVTTSLDVNRDVQVPQTGLPDPVFPVAPTLRRRQLLPIGPIEPNSPADPYSSLGLKSGGLIFYPAIEQGIGYDSNPNRESPNHGGSPWLRSDGQLRVRSEWSTHELTADLRGGYSAFPDRPEADRPDGIGNARLRIDIARDARIDLEGRYLIETQRPGSPEVNTPGVASRPLIIATGESLEVTKAFNRLSFALRGNLDRVVYQDARLPNGTILPQGDRDQTTYGLRFRTAYELTPGNTPFVDALIDDRVYDQTIDNAGFRRSSSSFGARVGSTFDVARTLTGEVSAGYSVRRYEDLRLRDARGPVATASLNWAASPLTTVRLRAVSDIFETTVPGASGIFSKRATLEVQHDFRRNLSLVLGGTVLENTYQGANIREQGFSAAATLNYRLTRWLALRASYIHDRLRSNVPSSGYVASTYLVGMRFQP